MTDDLRRLAEAATQELPPGPWRAGSDEWPKPRYLLADGQCFAETTGEYADAAANWFAALSPSAVIPLLDVVEAARALIGVTTPVNVSGAEYQDRKIYYAMLRAALERVTDDRTAN